MLGNVRILDLSRVLAGPFATQTLADLGAEVLKIEHPEHVDETRSWGPPFVDGESSYFRCANRNKKFIQLNFSDDKDFHQFEELVKTADVVVENFLPHSVKKLKLSYEELRKIKTDIIVCSISGYGRHSPWADRAGYDFVIQAQAGWMNITGSKDGPPTKCGVAVVDTMTALYATNAIQAALIQRLQTGKGTHIDLSLLDCAVAGQVNLAQIYADTKIAAGRQGNEHLQIVPYQQFATKDGFLVIAAANDSQFQKLCKALGAEQLATDPMYCSNAQRVKHRAQLIPILQSMISREASQELSAKLAPANVPHGEVWDYAALNDSPIGKSKQYFAGGRVRSPFRFTD